MRIFTQYTDTKFVTSLADIRHPEINIASANIQQNLYKIHYMYNFDAYIFCANLLSSEIYQFINEFVGSGKKFIVYHSNIDTQSIIDALPDQCIHISNVIKHNKVIVIPYLVNDHIFNSFNDKKNTDILCFLDNYHDIPQRIVSLLYPDSTLPIKIFSKYIKHPQNLGIINELEKAQLLNSSQYYLSIDSGYEVEAVLCGATLVDINEDKEIIPISTNEIPKYQTYQDFLLNIL